MTVGGLIIANRVFAAPMSGVSDLPFRARTLGHGAGLAVAEMTVSGRLVEAMRDDSRRRQSPQGALRVVQLAGRDPDELAEAARICEGEGADIIDINMGCPAKKVTGGYAGSALLKEHDLALRLVDAVVGAVRVPVTLKTRLGWSSADEPTAEFCARAEAAGIAMLTIHGRTRCQFYKGEADWHAVRAIRDATKVPLVVNGDVHTMEDALDAIDASGADAVMIGRGTYGQPWRIGTILAEAGVSHVRGAPQTRDAMFAYVIEHYDDMLDYYGIERGLRHARKHLGWYLDTLCENLPDALRGNILRSEEPADVRVWLADAIGNFGSDAVLREAA